MVMSSRPPLSTLPLKLLLRDKVEVILALREGGEEAFLDNDTPITQSVSAGGEGVSGEGDVFRDTGFGLNEDEGLKGDNTQKH